jgi:hypothetical protein
MEESLAIVSTLFQPWLTNPYITHLVEVYFHPFFLDSRGSWKVFEDDRNILNFLNYANEFTDHTIDKIQEGEEFTMIQLKRKKIPMGLVPLENVFDRFDVFMELINLLLTKKWMKSTLETRPHQGSSWLVMIVPRRRRKRL